MHALRCCLVAVLCICLTIVPQLFAADENAQSQARLALMEQAISALEPSSSQIKSKTALTFVPKPLLRYSDPTRGLAANALLDAGVWRLGEQGRPTALVTLEIYPSSATEGVLSYEFLSLSNERFSLRHKQQPMVAWDATASALKLSPVPDAFEPATSPPARLSQMRQLAKRFAVREKLITNEEVVCRLLSQPIDRYQSPAQSIVDGAIFVFANGTNPEVGIVLEADSEQWSYGIVRLSAAESTITLDGREVAKFSIYGGLGKREGSYTSNNHPIQLPK
jgi:hypothetical protein